MLTGKEAVSLRVTSPSGVSTMLPFTLAESRGFYSAQCPWSEVGEFIVSITLDGEGLFLALSLPPSPSLRANPSTLPPLSA
jgi:hypothetical protein